MTESSDAACARDLTEQLLRTAVVLTDLLASLIEDLPDDAFRGEDNATVLRDRIISDLEAAARLAAHRDPEE